MKIELKEAKRADGDNWRVEVHVAGSDAELDAIERVNYSIHPCLPNPVRVGRNRSDKFAVKIKAWGTFDLTARVVFRTGGESILPCALQWDDGKGKVIGPLIPEGSSPPSPEECLKLGQRLYDIKSLSHARRVLAAGLRQAGDAPGRTKLIQTLVKATYKDTSISSAERYAEALRVLDKVPGKTAGNEDPETHGLAGAIHRRRWDVDGQRAHLERALSCYRRGYELARQQKQAGQTMRDGSSETELDQVSYNGINVAFLEDLLDALETSDAAGAQGFNSARRTRADALRKELIAHVNQEVQPLLPHLGALEEKEREKAWWLLATLIEAQVGSGDYNGAKRSVSHANALKHVPEWMRESTARQLSALIRLRWKSSEAKGDVEADRESPHGIVPGAAELERIEMSPEWGILNELMQGDADLVRSVLIGKVGLALSGGGFRASLYHIGVLARLAEMDVLRHVEVISCVSGGSIIGAHYYLALRDLLERYPDQELDKEAYLTLVEHVADTFLEGVQTNIRTRVAAHLPTNIKMVLFPQRFSRSERVGRLYEEKLFARLKGIEGKNGRWTIGDTPVAGAAPLLSDLFIHPRTIWNGKAMQDQLFSPSQHNWRRRAKVPVLILNATALNTGHTWQFTASWMGEPPDGVDAEVGGNERLRRMHYPDAPASHRNCPLGRAVASSSCVPGLFDPVTLEELYPQRTVRLVDGGVHDNQGASGLLEQECTVLLVSDASGQMGSDKKPGNAPVSVLLRSNSILQSRVREAEYKELDARRRSGLLRGLMFIHLKKDIDASPVNWSGFKEPVPWLGTAAGDNQMLTPYGIRPERQHEIASLRTDLDSFSDVEAYALMTSGYRMTEWEFPRSVRWPYPQQTTRHPWKFLSVESALRDKNKSAECASHDIPKQLQVGSSLAFRIWKLSPALKASAWILAALAVLGVGYLVRRYWHTPLITVGGIAASVGVIVLGAMIGKAAMKVIRLRDTAQRIGLGIALASVGWVIALIHLAIFDRWFLRWGKVTCRQNKGASPLNPNGDGSLLEASASAG